MRLWNRIRFLLGRRRRERELAAEIEAHREMLAERFASEGMTASDAARAARREFGNDLAFREQSHDQWGFAWLGAAWRDAVFAVRLLRRQPLVTAAAVLTVALGVGANTAIVSVLETVLLNPLGIRDAGRVMAVTTRFDALQLTHAPVSGVEYREMRALTGAFSAAAAIERRAWTATIGGGPVRLLGHAVTPDFFRLFNERPLVGRFLSPQDDEPVAVLSYRLWQTQFGGDPAAIGRTIELDGRPFRIVGVAPERFRFPAEAQLWTPLVLSPQSLAERGRNMNYALFVRLRDGITPAQATRVVNRWVAGLKAPGMPEAALFAKFGYFIDLESFARNVAGDLRRPLWLLFTAALVVLLAGCANVAVLLLARTASRRRELAIRLAVGATRFQIVRQLLIESLLLGALGGLCGLGVAAGAVSLLARLAVPGKDLLSLVTLDLRLMLYGLGLSLACGLIFGVAPALHMLRQSQSAALVRGVRRRFQNVFVTAQVAAAFVLLVSTGLLLRSLWAVEQIHPGFDPAHLTTAYMLPPRNDPGFFDRLDANLHAMPGVESAALALPVPFDGGGFTSMFGIRGRAQQGDEAAMHGEAFFVSPTYFETLRIPLVRGRLFTAADSATAPQVCLIDVRMAERFFPNENPIGHVIEMYGSGTIVGVVGTIRTTTLDATSLPTVYQPLAQQAGNFPFRAAVVRSAAPAGALIRQAVRQANGSVPVYDVATMEERIGETLGIRRVLARLVSIFGAICLLLATIGLNGVVAQIAGERTTEIGVRMALGARPGQILARFLGQGLLSGAAGLVIGLACSLYAQRWIAGLLFEVRPFDPITFGAVGLGLMLVLSLAVYWPARRASRIDPLTALRHE
jgi:predicted permease